MGLEGTLSLSTSAGCPDQLCLLSSQGDRRLLGMNHLQMSRGWKVRDRVGVVRCESFPHEQGGDNPISKIRPHQGTSSSHLKSRLEHGADDISRTDVSAPAQGDRENDPDAVTLVNVSRYSCARSRASIALQALDVYLHLAASICDEVDTAFTTSNSRKPLRLSTTSWELLE